MADTPKSPTPEKEEKQGSLEQRVKDLESANAALRAGLPLNLTPVHGAGEGSEVAETWSQAEQEAARAT